MTAAAASARPARRVVGVVCALAAAAGCDLLADRVACAADDECDDGARCVDGWCAARAVDDDAGGRPRDAGDAPVEDAGRPNDAGSTSDDAGARADDAGLDAGPRDGGDDAGPTDAGLGDAGPSDAGEDGGDGGDGGVFDAGPPPVADSLRVVVRPGGTVVVSLSGSGSGALTYDVDAASASGVALAAAGSDVTYVADPVRVGRDSFTYRVVDDVGASASAVVEVLLVGRSCAVVRMTGGDDGDGLYAIDEDGDGGQAAYVAWCDMTEGAVLAAKIDGATSTWTYDAALWTNASLLAPDAGDLSRVEAKLPSYLRQDVGVVLARVTSTAGGPVRRVRLPLDAPRADLQALFAGAPQSTWAGLSAWLATTPGADAACVVAEGVNVALPDGGPRARLGLVAADGDGAGDGGCAAPDALFGAGLAAACDGGVVVDVSAGAACAVAGDDATPAFVELYAREIDFRALPSAPSCTAHRLAGRDLTGAYLVDGVDGGVFDAWCEQTVGGGGWMLAARSVAGASGSFGWTEARGEILDDGEPYSLAPQAIGYVPTDLMVASYVGDGKSFGPNAYRLAVPNPEDFYTNCATSSCQLVDDAATVAGTCNEYGPTILRYWGYTTLAPGYWFRDISNAGDAPYDLGLYPHGLDTYSEDCARGGFLDGRQGMLFLR